MFENSNPNPVATVLEANKLIAELQGTPRQQNHSSNHVVQMQSPWRPPPQEFIKINSDASYGQHTRVGYAGILGRNDQGGVVMGLTKKFPVSSPLLAEAMALREATLAATNFGIPRIILESDCLILIRACRDELQYGEIAAVVQGIK